MHTTQLDLGQDKNITRPSSSLSLSKRRELPVGMTMVVNTSAMVSKAMVIQLISGKEKLNYGKNFKNIMKSGRFY